MSDWSTAKAERLFRVTAELVRSGSGRASISGHQSFIFACHYLSVGMYDVGIRILLQRRRDGTVRYASVKRIPGSGEDPLWYNWSWLKQDRSTLDSSANELADVVLERYLATADDESDDAFLGRSLDAAERLLEGPLLRVGEGPREIQW